MRNRISLLCITCGALLAGAGMAADTHVVTVTPELKWSYKGQSSQITVVGDLKIGDVIDVQIPAGIPHGFSTIKKDPPPITSIEDPVLKCGEAESAKPEAVLKEIECGAQSRFGVRYTGSMKLEVLPSFKGEVPFWCIVHKAGMQGVLRMQAADTHVVTVTPELKWSYKGQSSQITVVGDLKIGDVIDVRIPAGIPHGFSTIKKEPPPITQIEDPVLKCGEDSSAKPKPVLKEIECGDKSQFGERFIGSMKLEVLPSFKDELPFWCVVHKAGMQGILRMQPN